MSKLSSDYPAITITKQSYKKAEYYHAVIVLSPSHSRERSFDLREEAETWAERQLASTSE